MKNLVATTVVFLISLFFSIEAGSYVVTQLGTGWECIDNCDLQGKVVNGTIFINGDLETSTRAWVECSGAGYCARVNGGGFIEIDLLPEIQIAIIPDQAVPSPLENDQKLFGKH